jgi:hypothetical protein
MGYLSTEDHVHQGSVLVFEDLAIDITLLEFLLKSLVMKLLTMRSMGGDG